MLPHSDFDLHNSFACARVVKIEYIVLFHSINRYWVIQIALNLVNVRCDTLHF